MYKYILYYLILCYFSEQQVNTRKRRTLKPKELLQEKKL